MILRTAVIAAASLGLLVSGCSTKPRNFAAEISAPVASRTAVEQDYRICDTLVRGGRTSDFKGAALSGLAAGAGTFGATAAAATVGGIGITGATTAASLAIPGVGLIAGIGMARMIRGGRERKFKRRMTTCLQEFGYSVEGWSKLKKRVDAAAAAAAATAVAEEPVLAASSAGEMP